MVEGSYSRRYKSAGSSTMSWMVCVKYATDRAQCFMACGKTISATESVYMPVATAKSTLVILIVAGLPEVFGNF